LTTTRWQISVGQISEWLPPLLYAAAVLISAWVLSDARRRRFSLPAVAAWTFATLISPPIILPLYLLTRILTRKPDATDEVAASTPPTDTEADESVTPASISDDTGGQADDQSAKEIRRPLWRKKYALPLLYALALPLLYTLALLSAGAIYFYRDYHTFDAHLTRATKARLLGKRAVTIRAYRAALRLADDAHTRKLLAIQLAADGQTEAALAEFRAAERGGEPDELLPFRTAHALDTLGRPAEAHLEYQKFLQGNLCARSLPDMRCAEASARTQQIQSGVVGR